MSKKHLLPDHPISEETERIPLLKFLHPNKVSWDQIESELEEAIKPFITNMKNLSYPEEDFMENKMAYFSEWFLD